MLTDQKQKLVSAIIAACVGVLVASVPGWGLLLGPAIIGLIVWIPLGIRAAIKKPETRPLQAAYLIIYLLAISIVITLYHDRADAARKSGDAIVTKIDEFTARNGRCPASFDEIGISKSDEENLPGLPRYSCEDGKPHLTYLDVMDPYGHYWYDFQDRVWRGHSD